MAREPEPIRLTTLDTMLVDVPISAVDANGAAVDLTGDAVALGFMPKGVQPVEADMHLAVWNDAGDAAAILVGPGPGGHAYPLGKYVAWWTCPDNPEIPFRPAPEPGAPPLLIITET